MTKELKQDESAKLLPRSSKITEPKFSVLRTRITSSFVPIFSLSAGSARDSLLPQYLLQRLSDEAGLSNNTHLNPCLADKNDSHKDERNDLEAQVSNELMYLTLALTVPAFFACLLMGSYADYVGRRPLLLFSVFAHFMRTFLICCVIKFQLDLRFLYLATGVDGVAGSWYLMQVALFSITADISSSLKDKTFWVYFVGCSASIMAAVYNVATGYLINYYGFFEAALFISCLMFIAFIVPLIFLPETLHRDRSLHCVSPLTHMRKIFGFYFVDGTFRHRAMFYVCTLLFLVGAANDINIGSMDSMYQMHDPFCWDSTEIGDYSAIRSAGSNFFGVILFRVLQACFSVEHLGMFGVLFQGGAFVFEAFIQVSWQFYLVPVFLIPGVPTVSIIRTMFSMLAGQDHQGAVFSTIAILETLCNLASTQLYNTVYSATVSFMSGAVYLVMASASFITFFLFGIYFLIRERPNVLDAEVVTNLTRQETIQRSDFAGVE